MSLEKEFGVPKETITRMVTRGVISCSIVKHYEIYDTFQEMRSANPTMTKSEIYHRISERANYSVEMVKTIVHKLGNK